MAAPAPRHHVVVRITHWVNALALFIMVGSGLRIFNAYPAFARKGETFCCYPFAGHPIPDWLTFGGWLAGARRWHFAAMWLLVANGLLYVAFIYLHGEWRDLVPRRGVIRDALEMVKFYLRLRKDHPAQGKHNALQRLAYFSLPYVAFAAVISGLAIWKPVQLAPLTRLMGGFAWARYWHFLVMLALVLFSLGHMFMVFVVDPRSLRSMIVGVKNSAPAGDPPKPHPPEADPPPQQPPVQEPPNPPPEPEQT
jgi:Ni/Fe-hydrogenase b-type cytochrome subunit